MYLREEDEDNEADFGDFREILQEEETDSSKSCLSHQTAIGYIFWYEEDTNNNHQLAFPRFEYASENDVYVREIPYHEFIKAFDNQELSWLTKQVKSQVLCYGRCIEGYTGSGCSGFQLSNSFVCSTRNFTLPNGVDIHCSGSVSAVALNFIDFPRRWPLVKRIETEFSFLEKYFPDETLPTCSSEGMIEQVPNLPFDLTMLELNVQSTTGIKLKEYSHEYTIPQSCEMIQVNDPIIIIGYPKRITTYKYEKLAYSKQINRRTFKSLFFHRFIKTGSIGRIKSFNDKFMEISNAAVCGMGGSPVFTFSGQLIGLLIGSTRNRQYNIVMRVDHPTFVLEYLSFPAWELLEMDSEFYFPLLKSFIEKHLFIIEKGIVGMELNERRRNNLINVLKIFNQYK